MPSELGEWDDHFYANVCALAHYLYVARGGKEGEDEKNWREAQRQLKRYRSCTGVEPAVVEAKREEMERILKAIKNAPELNQARESGRAS